MTIMLNNFLHNGDSVPNIICNYANMMRKASIEAHNEVDLHHSSFLLEYLQFVGNNKFILQQTQKIYEFFHYLEKDYSFLSFTLKGRIKSLFRVEEKYNGYIMEFIENYYRINNSFPSAEQINNYLKRYNDLIAYRLVINFPKGNIPDGKNKNEIENKYLYGICNKLPRFLQERGFDIIPICIEQEKTSPLLNKEYKLYVKDYVSNPKGAANYRSLHICFFDLTLRIKFEIQLRTKEMDDNSEIGQANHTDYEKNQNAIRTKREFIKKGQNIYYDDAFERIFQLRTLDLTKIDVDMFTYYGPYEINDYAGLLKGRLISPYEYL